MNCASTTQKSQKSYDVNFLNTENEDIEDNKNIEDKRWSIPITKAEMLRHAKNFPLDVIGGPIHERMKKASNWPQILKVGIYAMLRQKYHCVAQYADLYKQYPWAKNVLIKFAEIYPVSAMDSLHLFADEVWARDVVKKAREQCAGCVIEGIPAFIAQPWAEKEIAAATELDPGTTLRVIDRLQGSPFCLRILEKAAKIGARENPYATVKYSKRYSGQSYYSKVYDEAKNARPDAVEGIFPLACQ